MRALADKRAETRAEAQGLLSGVYRRVFSLGKGENTEVASGSDTILDRAAGEQLSGLFYSATSTAYYILRTPYFVHYSLLRLQLVRVRCTSGEKRHVTAQTPVPDLGHAPLGPLELIRDRPPASRDAAGHGVATVPDQEAQQPVPGRRWLGRRALERHLGRRGKGC